MAYKTFKTIRTVKNGHISLSNKEYGIKDDIIPDLDHFIIVIVVR